MSRQEKEQIKAHLEEVTREKDRRALFDVMICVVAVIFIIGLISLD